MKNDYVMLFLLGAGIVWFIISNIRMYRFLRSAVQSKTGRTGLDVVFSMLVIISAVTGINTLMSQTSFMISKWSENLIFVFVPLMLFFALWGFYLFFKKRKRWRCCFNRGEIFLFIVLTLLVLTEFWISDKIIINRLFPLTLFFFWFIFYNHLCSYFPKAEGAERLQVIFEHILYYPACAFLFVYIVMGFMHCFVYVAYPDVWDSDVCRKTGICKEGLSFNDRGKHEYSVTKEWCRDGLEKREVVIYGQKRKNSPDFTFKAGKIC